MVDCIAPIYLPAAYNGVFFQAVTANSDHGRRGVTGEFPFGEQTAYQDMGIKIRRYSVSGHYQGPNCVAQTAALIAAIETPGPGILIHPTRGVLTVACTSMKVKDDLLQGAGETNFDMEFVDASSFSVGLGSLPIVPAIAGILADISTTFIDRYDVSGLFFFEKTPVQAVAQEALTALATAFYEVIPGNTNLTVWQTLYQIQAESTNFDTWLTADGMIKNITFAFAAIDTYAKSPEIEFATFKKIANTFSRVATIPNKGGLAQEAVYSSMRTLSAAYMLRAATQIVVGNLEDALAEMDAISAIILEEKANALASNENDLYISLSNFQSMALKALLSYSYDLPPVVSYNFRGGVPSLVAAHEIYGDCTKFIDLEIRNPNNWAFALGPVIYAVGKTP